MLLFLTWLIYAGPPESLSPDPASQTGVNHQAPQILSALSLLIGLTSARACVHTTACMSLAWAYSCCRRDTKSLIIIIGCVPESPGLNTFVLSIR